jgi:hypothetical protein
MNQILPAQDGLLDFNRRLDQVARTNGVSLRFDFQPGGNTAPSGDQPGSLAFRMDVSGTFEQLANFFKEVEKNSTQFIMSVDSFDASMAGEGSYRVASRAKVFFR